MQKLINKKKILAIIPARGGSKGIPNKNLSKIGKTTLLEKAINDCKKVKRIDDIVVSTDSKRIREVSKKNKINVPFIRSKKNSTSKSSIIDGLIETIIKSEKYYKKNYDTILLIEVTSPLRTFSDINKSLNKFYRLNFDFLWTISKINLDFHPQKQLKLKRNKITFFDRKGLNIKNRQQLNFTYRKNCVCDVINKRKFLNIKKLINDNTGCLILDDYHVSIDTKYELNYVKKIYNKKFK